MSRIRNLVLVLAAFAGALAAPVLAEDAPDSRAARTFSLGLVATVPPDSGDDPAAAVDRAIVAEWLAAASSTSSEGLVEFALPGGGFGVDLQGRFQTAIVATLAVDGRVVLTEATISGVALEVASSAGARPAGEASGSVARYGGAHAPR